MINEETKFKNYGMYPHKDFFKEVEDEGLLLNLNNLPLGLSAERKSTYWNIYVEYINRVDIEKLHKLIKCNKDTIKLYNNEYSEELFYRYALNSVTFCVHTFESVKNLINFLSHYNVKLNVYRNGTDILNTKVCRDKSTVKSAILLKEPCYIIDKNSIQRYCPSNTYIVVYNDGSLMNFDKTNFDELFELY